MNHQRTIDISHREKQVLQCIADGLTSRQIAEILFLSLDTIETHRKSILNKLGVNNMTQAVAYALRNQIIV